jgi:hypothetical protein
MRIDAILSDYDGTLCPTSSLRSQDNSNTSSRIRERLETMLWNISEKIDVCIVSSKDFGFLHPRPREQSLYIFISTCESSCIG